MARRCIRRCELQSDETGESEGDGGWLFM